MSLLELTIPDIYSFEEKTFLRRALKLARKRHSGQLRASREPYIIHPIETTQILMTVEAPAVVVAAGFLHDVLEDTNEDFSELERLFGFETAKMVNAVTKSKHMEWVVQHYPEKKREEEHHYFLDIMKDPYAALVKVADRLANMRTIGFLPRKKQLEKAEETVKMYIPLAEGIGTSKIAAELDEICRKVLPAEEYEEACELSEQYRQEIEEMDYGSKN